MARMQSHGSGIEMIGVKNFDLTFFDVFPVDCHCNHFLRYGVMKATRPAFL